MPLTAKASLECLHHPVLIPKIDDHIETMSCAHEAQKGTTPGVPAPLLEVPLRRTRRRFSQVQIVTSIRIAAAPMIKVADQPTTLMIRLFTCRPMTRSLLATSMMTTISGGAIKPLMTAE